MASKLSSFPPFTSAFPVFLLGAVVVLIVYQMRLGWHQAVRTGDDYEALEMFRTVAPAEQLLQEQQAALELAQRDTLVVYIYNEDDAVYRQNYEHFLIAGVQQNSRCQYVVVVQERSLKSAAAVAEARGVDYIYYGGTCYEWGIIGWLLHESSQINWQQFSYFIFISSAVRGPFLPTYLQGTIHWADALLHRLTERIKLVGPTVVCSGAPAEPGNVNASWRRNPHIPFSAVATDRVGLDVLRADDQVMACHDTVWAAKYHSELGASAAMFKQGYGIDSLLIRYQGVDWSQASAWDCNRNGDPANTGDFAYDGIALDPMEVIFVRVNSALLGQRVPMAVKAVKYSTWMADIAAAAVGQEHNLTARVSENAYAREKAKYKLPRILTTLVRGFNCFDANFFLAHNRDIFQQAPKTHLTLQIAWKFFVYLGQFEDRPFRYICGPNYSSVATPAF